MIHSMCGGGLKDNEVLSYAKVIFDDNPIAEKRAYWYKSGIVDLAIGEKVIAPFGREQREYIATVIRVDRVSEQTPPMPLNRMGSINKRA